MSICHFTSKDQGVSTLRVCPCKVGSQIDEQLHQTRTIMFDGDKEVLKLYRLLRWPLGSLLYMLLWNSNACGIVFTRVYQRRFSVNFLWYNLFAFSVGKIVEHVLDWSNIIFHYSFNHFLGKFRTGWTTKKKAIWKYEKSYLAGLIIFLVNKIFNPEQNLSPEIRKYNSVQRNI